ncbi:restriction endonuclease subunit S [Vibrio parahaemolyticus]|nr:restriction endonuclease subunit S [Vibrio parahaemolyticus]
MTGRYKAYPEYKDSPIDWLDEIPTHWTTKKLKHLGEAIIGLTYSPDEVVDASDPDATLVLRSSNVQNQRITLNDNVFVSKQIPEKLLTRLNDILICSRNGSRALIGKNALIDKDSVGKSFGAFMTIYRSKYNTYLSHVMNSKLFEYQSGSFLTSTINQLTTGNLNSFEIPFPSEAERENIASFLDHETAKIDTLIAKQEKLIELLKEKRQAVISHAVTKGLNPDAPMKNSGVEWLGEVPEHWVVGSLRWRISISSGEGIPSSLVEKNKTELKQVPVIGGNGVMGFTETPNTSRAAIAIGRVGALCGNVHLVNYVSWITDNALKVSSWDGFDEYYLVNLLKAANLNDLASKTAQPLITGEQIKSLTVVIPPIEEQVNINLKLTEIANRFDKLEQKSVLGIELLKERKTVLISAAVTGKIDVRDWKPAENNLVEVA